jgi:hypothetical protein
VVIFKAHLECGTSNVSLLGVKVNSVEYHLAALLLNVHCSLSIAHEIPLMGEQLAHLRAYSVL